MSTEGSKKAIDGALVVWLRCVNANVCPEGSKKVGGALVVWLRRDNTYLCCYERETVIKLVGLIYL